MKSFVRDFKYDTAHATRVNSLAVGLQQAGAFAACFVIWPIADRLGRKLSLQISSFIFIIGAMMETINSHNMGVFYAGRVIAGVGLGAATVIVPMFNSEMAPKELRGQIGSFFQWFYTFGDSKLNSAAKLGIFTSYWVDYAMAEAVPSVTRQWQIPIGLQIIPAGLLALGTFTLKESTRWLTKKGRHEEAWESLKWIRADESQATVEEMEEIRVGVELEQRATEGFQIKELAERENFKRVFTAFAVFTAQQATGATAFAYYGPQYFKLLVGGGSKDLLLTAIFGAIKVVACGCFVLFLSNRVGRRGVLIGGAVFMSMCQIVTAIVVKELPASKSAGVTSSGIATVALIYLFVIAYNLSWGPLPWPYVSETGYCDWSFHPVVVQLCVFIDDIVYDRESWLTNGLSLEEIAHNDYGRASSYKDDAILVAHGATPK
ncbi:mfs quinate transporter protein [Rutstroemia sp. NJR-2017a BBW]|nr:mfs quinate transporter protein [Rutstroemia sp. NJR-2017a BBW]